MPSILVSDTSQKDENGYYEDGIDLREILESYGFEVIEIPERSEAAYCIIGDNRLGGVVVSYDKKSLEEAWREIGQIKDIFRIARKKRIPSVFLDYPSHSGITSDICKYADRCFFRENAPRLGKKMYNWFSGKSTDYKCDLFSV